MFDHDAVDDYTAINSQRCRATKQALLKAVSDGSYKVESKGVEILEVRSYEEAAAVVGVSTMKQFLFVRRGIEARFGSPFPRVCAVHKSVASADTARNDEQP